MKVLSVHPSDNVLVALSPIDAGEQISYEGNQYQMVVPVPGKHKFVTQDLQPGDPLIMYGVMVGKAKRPIAKGEWISVENVAHATSQYGTKRGKFTWEPPDVSRWEGREFMGYKRSDGQVGTLNNWLIIPLVFCENRNVQILREAFEKELGYAQPDLYRQSVRELVDQYTSGKSIAHMPHQAVVDQERSSSGDASSRVFPFLDGIKFLTHEGGCGGTREDAQSLCSLLAGYLHHPNVAGATVLSLGCQNAQINMLQEEIEKKNPDFDKPLLIFEQQRGGSETTLMKQVIRETFLGLMQANERRRTPAPLSALTLGMECGGSDGFSGISANPTLGQAADYLVALGGKVILSEFPELCGVEQELINRCISDHEAERFAQLMRTYQHQAEAVGSGFDMNPSPGNIKDGLITDGIKSAGAAKKGGTSPVRQVLGYPEYATEAGLSLLCTPGNDVESTTGLAGAGANIILFTTGLGTPTGNPIAPVVKVSSNSQLAQRMPDIIDFNTGPIITGEESIERMGEKLLDYVIDLASGTVRTHAQRLGQDDFIPWKRGVSL
ncbi:MAG: altronate dehydratase family protein [Bacteroidota bacterium]